MGKQVGEKGDTVGDEAGNKVRHGQSGRQRRRGSLLVERSRNVNDSMVQIQLAGASFLKSTRHQKEFS